MKVCPADKKLNQYAFERGVKIAGALILAAQS
jgi:hypothetical protein